MSLYSLIRDDHGTGYVGIEMILFVEIYRNYTVRYLKTNTNNEFQLDKNKTLHRFTYKTDVQMYTQRRIDSQLQMIVIGSLSF